MTAYLGILLGLVASISCSGTEHIPLPQNNNYTTLYISRSDSNSDSDILYIGGKNLLKLQYDPASSIHPSIERRIVNESLDNSFKDCLAEPWVNGIPSDGIPREPRVTSILEVDENLLFCTNFTEYCYLIPSDDFQGKTIWSQHTGMPPDGDKRRVLVQELADNSGINHKVLYVAKMKNNGENDGTKCSERILTTMEIDPLALYPKKTSQSLRRIFLKDDTIQSQAEFNSLEVNANPKETDANGKVTKEWTNDAAFIATFTFVEPTTKMSWFYYVSKIVTTYLTDQKHPSVKYVVGRTCSADVYLRYVSEIQIQCGDHDEILMASFDDALGLLVLNNKGGLCSWTVDSLERTFNKMSKSCWYLYGCEDEEDSFDQCPTEVPNQDKAKLRSEPPVGELYVDRIQHYMFMGKAPQGKRCKKNSGIAFTDIIKSEIKDENKLEDLDKCPEYDSMYEDDSTMTLFCPFQYRDFPQPKDGKEPEFQIEKIPYVCVPFVPFQTGNSFLAKTRKLKIPPAYELGSKFRENNFQFEAFQALFRRVEDKLAIFILSQKPNQKPDVLLWSFEDSGFASKAQQTANPVTLNGFSSSILDFAVKNNNIFALTENDVTVRKIHNCEQIKTCGDCLNSDFPSCGWCAKRGKCTDRATCDAIDPKNWISQSGTCPKLETSNKKFFSANEKSIELKLSLSHDYSNLNLWKCGLNSEETNLTFINDDSGRIICDLPKNKADFIVKPNDKGVIKVESARVLYNHVTIAHTELDFYDCTQVDQNKRCTSCLEHTDWKCYWDRSTSKCSDNASIEENANIERANLCPSISAAETIEKVYAPEIKDIAFKVHNNDGNSVGYCHLSTENSEIVRRNATRGSDNQIICKDISMTVVNNVEENVFIKYSSGGYFFDSLDDTFFVIKDCGFKNPTCTQCRVRDGCSYVAGKCVRETAGHEDSVCDPPKVHMITPSSGLVSDKGNVAKTPFIITGEQLFVDADAVEVKIGNYDCDVVKEETYSENPIGNFSTIDVNRQRLSQIKCFVSSPISIANDYEITIKRNDGSKTTADQKITITDPSVDKISPEYGIKAGFTEITVHGKFLDSGASQSVKIGTEECTDLVVKKSMISCRTPAMSEGHFSEDVSLNMDGRVFVLPKSFNYIGNPSLEIKNNGFVHMCDGERSCKPVDTIPTFLSGGGRIWFTLAGFSLGNIFNNSSSMPIIYAGRNGADKEMQSDCFLGQLPSPPLTSIVEEDGIRSLQPTQETFDFYCELPRTQETRRRRRRSLEQQELTIRYDGWSDNSLKLDVYAEPSFVLTKDEREFAKRSFENVTICFKDPEAERKFREHSWMSTEISIPEEGIENLVLNTVSQHETNDESCSVIEFKLPDNIEEETFNARLLTLKARFGILEDNFATLRVPPKLSVATMSISIICIFVFILIIVMIVYPLYNKYRATQKKHMSLEKKLHAVEEKVSAVAKRAYFELSMELPEIVEDNAQMPVQDYSRYINNVLFPNPGDETPPRQYPESSLIQLKKLLDNPTFTQKALRAIETQPKCTSRDKAKIAAYIMSIFADNPQFITKLTFDLVDSYLKDSVGRTPKLAFRFSNAVVERLLGHWMHLTLYDFLNSDTGKSLWVLLRAIKQQGWKGPVDVVKGHAQFTLTENRLLKEDIEFTPMKLSVIPPEVREDTTEPSYVFVQILDCDTITQVKEKCMDAVYSNIPYSKWPRSEEIALEFRIKRVKVPLVEGQSQPDASNRHRYMTVKDYNIKENNVIAMVKKQVIESTSSDMLPHESDTQETDPLRGAADLGDTYHLVKPGDEDLESRNRQSMVDPEVNNLVSDLYLQRLITSKHILQPYVDMFFNYILIDEANTSVPPPIKYLFDFLDKSARNTVRHGTITSQTSDIEDALPYWKTNCLILRFWANIMSNPTFFLDVPVPDLVSPSVTVVLSTLMECGQDQGPQVNDQDPVNRMLFQKTINQYRDKVRKFYRKVQDIPPVSQNEVVSYIETQLYSNYKAPKTDKNASLACLLNYIAKFESQIASKLEDDLGDTPEVQKLIDQMNRICRD